MNNTAPFWRPSRILAASDLSPVSDKALQYAASVARHFDACVYLTHVLPMPSDLIASREETSADKNYRDEAEEKISVILKSEQMRGIRSQVLLEKGFLWETLDTLIRKHAIDFVVVGTHGHKNIEDDFGGSLAELIFRHADCPVMIVGPCIKDRSPVTETFENILLATDFGRASQRSVPYACSLAKEYGATLTLIHVLTVTGAQDPASVALLQETTRVRLLESLPPGAERHHKCEFVVRSGDSAHEILMFTKSRNIDLIVMGAKSGTPMLNHVPEATTFSIAKKAHCPVLTIKA